MSRICQVTGKKAQYGHLVSHANNRTNRRFEINLQTKRYWFQQEKRWIRLRVTAHGMKIINRRGLASVVNEMRARGLKI